MKHLGDITKINGHEVPGVDCVVGGSPCQDLSQAGLMIGLAGDRSGLFFQQIRIIKEMRDNDRANGRTGVDIRPRYGIWENVVGALSSPGKKDKGKDFAVILTEFIRVAEPEAPPVAVPEEGWPTSGCIIDEMGNWSICWRVMDAQYWGVPQRRRRICLVCDFNGLNAPKIVFGEFEHIGSTEQAGRESPDGHIGGLSRSSVQPVSQGLPGNPDESQQERQATAGDAGDGLGGAIGCDLYNGALSGDKAVTLNTNTNATGAGPTVVVPEAFGCDTYNYTVTGDKACTLNSNSCITSSRVGPTVCQPVAYNGSNITSPINKTNPQPGDPCHTLTDDNRNYLVQSVIAVDQGGGKSGASHYEDISPTLTCTNDGAPAVVYGISPYHSNAMKSDNPHSGYYEADTARTLDALQCGYPGCNQGGMAVVQPILDDQGGSRISVRDDGKCPTLRAEAHGNLPCVLEMQGFGKYKDSGIASSLKARDYKDATDLVVAGVDCRNATEIPGQNITLQSSCYHNLNSGNVVRVKHIVRRLTPLECERLQGFPDNWTLIGEPIEEEVADYTYIFDESKYVAPKPEDFGLTDDYISQYADVDDDDIYEDCDPEEDEEYDKYLEYLDACENARRKATKKVKIGSHMETNYYYTDLNGKRKKVSDSARYKALGNSIALPPWKWIIKRLCACYERDATMASLFDGIGGFPLIWEQLNGKGSCLWASEIEDFPMAVTIYRFGGNENG